MIMLFEIRRAGLPRRRNHLRGLVAKKGALHTQCLSDNHGTDMHLSIIQMKVRRSRRLNSIVYQTIIAYWLMLQNKPEHHQPATCDHV